ALLMAGRVSNLRQRRFGYDAACTSIAPRDVAYLSGRRCRAVEHFKLGPAAARLLWGHCYLWHNLVDTPLRPRTHHTLCLDRRIIGFNQDDEKDCVAELECGHNQHVRHNPPWTNRPYVTTPEGRATMIGRVLACRQCAQAGDEKLRG